VNSKIVTVDQALDIVRSGDTLGVSGFRWAGSSELMLRGIGQRFRERGTPRDLTLVFSSASGDNVSNGLEHLAQAGLLRRVVGGFWGATPALAQLAVSGQVEAYNLPQGQIARLYNAIAAGLPGLLSRVGLGTFIDPRIEGGRANDRTPPDHMEVVTVRGEEFLLYHAFPIHVALVRGTTADTAGNISMEDEAVTTEALALALAAHNSGGHVVAQVARVVERGAMHPRAVAIPGHIVDMVVVAADRATEHRQCVGSVYDPTITGDAPAPIDTSTETALPLIRRLIAQRAMQELRPGQVVNLGQGIPSEIAGLVRHSPLAGEVTFTIESGVNGGIPKPVPDFGIAVAPESIMRQDDQFTFYNGGGLDVAFLGFAEVDARGDMNVSRFGGRLVGCGGFLDIAQPARRLVFCGTFLAGKCELEMSDGRLTVVKEATGQKFVNALQQLTFSATRARNGEQPVLYVTERCVFDIVPEGLRLVEVAPGIDVERDILAHMPFKPIIAPAIRPMYLG
jgi:propionate CoA-transferase